MTRQRPQLIRQMSVFSDTARARLLLLLERDELTVSELRGVVQMPQSSVSRQLKMLSDAGWVTSRPEGTSRRYTMVRNGLAPSNRSLWLLIRKEIAGTTAVLQDQRRLRGALARRRTRSQEFFSSEAGRWDSMRDELFGNRFHLLALLGLLEESATVGDLGCGTGQVTEALAPFVGRVIAVDESAAMIRAARRRLEVYPNVEVRQGELEALPIDDKVLDLATLILVLHHLPQPGKAIAEVARALRPGGRLVVVDMLPHAREEYRQRMGHLWLGFSEENIRRFLEDADLTNVELHALPVSEEAKGPTLFAARARRRGADAGLHVNTVDSSHTASLERRSTS